MGFMLANLGVGINLVSYASGQFTYNLCKNKHDLIDRDIYLILFSSAS